MVKEESSAVRNIGVEAKGIDDEFDYGHTSNEGVSRMKGRTVTTVDAGAL